MIEKVIFNLERPNLEFEVEFSNLTLLLGKNETHKSFVMKMVWLLQYMFYAKHVIIDTLNNDIQDLVNSTFDAPDFTGKVTVITTKNAESSITFEDGKVIDHHVTILGELPIVPIFHSAQMRTFDDKFIYLVTRKSLGANDKLLEVYKLYDILAVEHLITKIQNLTPAEIREIQERLNGFTDILQDKKIANITVDLDKPGFYIHFQGDAMPTDMRTLSAGVQSILTMIL